MIDLKNFYDKYWNKEEDPFGQYSRDQVLEKLFKHSEYILDVGCGDGTVLDFLQKKLSVKGVGIDISENAVKLAKAKGLNVAVYNSEEKFPFKNNTFDAVFWGDNMEHLFDPQSCAKEIKRVLKKNGRLILSCPNMGYWRYRIHYLIKGCLPDTEWTGLPPWQWAHIRFFNIKIIKDFLKSCGFEKINKVIGISERRLDKPLIFLSPTLFGMIFLVEVS